MHLEVAEGFDWDDGNRGKCQKHGVALDAIEGLFATAVTILTDSGHSLNEERYKAIGNISNGRHILVVFTFRNNLIRPISARYMHMKEVAYYEKAIAGSRDR